MFHKIFVRTALVAAFITASMSAACAEMGKAPAAPGQWYVSLFGGYVHQDGPKTEGHNTGNAFTPSLPVEVEHGGFLGGTLGYVLGRDWDTMTGFQNIRIESAFTGFILDDDKVSTTGGGIASVSADAHSSTGGQPARSKQERSVFEGSLALKGDAVLGNAVDLTGGLELFIRHTDDTTSTFCCNGGVVTRDADIDTWFYGAMAVLQPELPIAEGFSLVADLGAGIYLFDTDGDLSSVVLAVPQSISTDRTDVGFRGRVSGGLKYAFAPGMAMTLFGGVDYWSVVPYAKLPTTQLAFGGIPASLETDDLLELKFGASVSIALGGGGN